MALQRLLSKAKSETTLRAPGPSFPASGIEPIEIMKTNHHIRSSPVVPPDDNIKRMADPSPP